MTSTIQQQQTVVDLNTPLFNGLGAILRAYGEDVVRALADKYHFDAAEGIATAIRVPVVKKAAPKERVKKEVATKPKIVKPLAPDVVIPWCGVVRDECCKGLRLNHGLHTQCNMLPGKSGDFCKTCQKQADSNANGAPDYGSTMMREAAGLDEYRDPKGKRSVAYTSVMKRLGITREAAEAAAAKLGQTIPEVCFQERVVVRARAKSAATDSDGESPAKPKKRRAKKPLQVVEGGANDLIATLVAQANAAGPAPPALSIQVDGTSGTTSPDSTPGAPAAPSPVVAPAAPPSPAAAPAAVQMVATVPEPSAAEKDAIAAKKAKAAEKRKKAKKAKEEAAALEAKEKADALAAKEAADQLELSHETVTEEPAAPKATAQPTMTINGVTYYEQEGWLYDMTNQECVGFWNGSEMEPVEDDDDDDE